MKQEMQPETPMTDLRIVVMGVSGCGKSTVGTRLAQQLGCRFIDGDDLHPQSNIDKMAASIPLTDEDRWPWLQLVGEALNGAPNKVDGFGLVNPTGTVVAASSLKRVYRDFIRGVAETVMFIHLDGTREVLVERLERRKGHFMGAQMLDSQLAILEPLAADEAGLVLNVSLSPNEIVERALAYLNAQ
jgi:carbohydrate kinase (thermoresistant glucokinase family)